MYCHPHGPHAGARRPPRGILYRPGPVLPDDLLRPAASHTLLRETGLEGRLEGPLREDPLCRGLSGARAQGERCALDPKPLHDGTCTIGTYQVIRPNPGQPIMISCSGCSAVHAVAEGAFGADADGCGALIGGQWPSSVKVNPERAVRPTRAIPSGPTLRPMATPCCAP